MILQKNFFTNKIPIFYTLNYTWLSRFIPFNLYKIYVQIHPFNPFTFRRIFIKCILSAFKYHFLHLSSKSFLLVRFAFFFFFNSKEINTNFIMLMHCVAGWRCCLSRINGNKSKSEALEIKIVCSHFNLLFGVNVHVVFIRILSALSARQPNKINSHSI